MKAATTPPCTTSTARLPRIPALNAWRGIFALLILLFHNNVPCLNPWARCGVTFFFVSSGFLSARSHPVAVMAGRGKRYVAERVLRTYPMHWLALAMYMAIGLSHHYVAVHPYFAAHVLLVQEFLPSQHQMFDYNGPSWFLGDLLLCYACFPLLIKWLKPEHAARQLCVAMALAVAYVACVSQGVSQEQISHLYTSPVVCVYLFALGIVLHNWYNSCFAKKDVPRSKQMCLEGASVLMIAVVAAAANAWPVAFDPYVGNVVWVVPVSLLVVASAAGFKCRLVSSAPLQWLGRHCFEIYLFQCVAGGIYNTLIAPVFGHWGVMVYQYHAIGSVAVVLPLAWFVHKCITTRLFGWVHRVVWVR